MVAALHPRASFASEARIPAPRSLTRRDASRPPPTEEADAAGADQRCCVASKEALEVGPFFVEWRRPSSISCAAAPPCAASLKAARDRDHFVRWLTPLNLARVPPRSSDVSYVTPRASSK